MSEAEICKRAGLEPVKNSGRGIRKGDFLYRDVRQGDSFVGDIKEGKSFQFSESAWAKICKDTISHGPSRSPMILRALPNGQLIACIEFSYLVNLLEELDEFRGFSE